MTWTLPAPSVDSSLQPNAAGWRGARPATALGHPSFLSGLTVSAEGHAARPRSSPSLGGPAQTLNFSGVQRLRRLLLPAPPPLPLDAGSSTVAVGAARHRLSLSPSQFGRADGRASPGCGWREEGEDPGARAPSTCAAPGWGGGSWCLPDGVERRCRQGRRLPIDMCGGRKIKEQKGRGGVGRAQLHEAVAAAAAASALAPAAPP